MWQIEICRIQRIHEGKEEKRRKKERREREESERILVSWCFKPSQPQRITSGLKSERKRDDDENDVDDDEDILSRKDIDQIANPLKFHFTSLSLMTYNI